MELGLGLVSPTCTCWPAPGTCLLDWAHIDASLVRARVRVRVRVRLWVRLRVRLRVRVRLTSPSYAGAPSRQSARRAAQTAGAGSRRSGQARWSLRTARTRSAPCGSAAAAPSPLAHRRTRRRRSGSPVGPRYAVRRTYSTGPPGRATLRLWYVSRRLLRASSTCSTEAPGRTCQLSGSPTCRLARCGCRTCHGSRRGSSGGRAAWSSCRSCAHRRGR